MVETGEERATRGLPQQGNSGSDKLGQETHKESPATFFLFSGFSTSIGVFMARRQVGLQRNEPVDEPGRRRRVSFTCLYLFACLWARIS